MGKVQGEKEARRQVRRVVGDESFLAMRQCYRVLHRGFWGRLKWLLFGR